jgi:hypothetical protein
MRAADLRVSEEQAPPQGGAAKIALPNPNDVTMTDLNIHLQVGQIDKNNKFVTGNQASVVIGGK